MRRSTRELAGHLAPTGVPILAMRARDRAAAPAQTANCEVLQAQIAYLLEIPSEVESLTYHNRRSKGRR